MADVNKQHSKTVTDLDIDEKFKKRYYKHKTSLETKNSDNTTTLSAHFWSEFEEGRAPKVTWKVLEKNIPSFNPVTGKCQLCIREKFYIVLKPHVATLNQRQEIFSNCRHKESRLLKKAPD